MTMKDSVVSLILALFLTIACNDASAQEKIKILSYNVLYGLKEDSVNIEWYISLINDLQPDIVATQEMNGWKQKTLEELAKRYGHPYALQSKEDGFPVALTSKTPMVNFRKVTENMWHSYIYAKVRGIHIFVIHFSPFSYQKRLEEVSDIIAQTREIPVSEPILIMGDFNSLSGSDSDHYGDELLQSMQNQEKKQDHIRNLNNGRIDYSVLGRLEEAGFKDSYKLLTKEFTASFPTFKDGNGNIRENITGIPRRIDFVWCNASAAKLVTKSIIIKNKLTDVISDHYPVYVELNVPKAR